MLKFFFILLFLQLFLGGAVNAEFKQCEYNPTYTIQNHLNSKWTRDFEKYISPFNLYKLLKQKNNIILSDLRPYKDFEKYHVKSSISFPYTSLLTKSMFKNNDIVLIGTGKDYKRVEQIYDRLKNRGFKSIKILDGGVYFWRSVIEKRSLNNFRISNLKNILNEDRSKWLIFDNLENNKIVDLFPHTINVSQKLSDINVTSYLSISKQSNNLIKNILIVSSEKNISQTINDWQRKLNANIFIIDVSKMKRAVNDYFVRQKIQSYKKRADGTKITCL